MSVRDSKLVLHVGRSKTGTTAFQQFLSSGRLELVGKGLNVPDFLRASNHYEFAVAYAKNPGAVAEPLLIESAAQRTALKKELRAKIRANVRPGQIWMISSEHLGTRMRTPNEVHNLLEDLRDTFDEIVVVAHLRRPDYLLPSLYSESLKAGRTAALDAAFVTGHRRAFNQQAFRELWTTEVAPLVLVPYVERFKREHILYLEQWARIIGSLTGIDIRSMITPTSLAKTNSALSAPAAEYLRQVNLRSDVKPRLTRRPRARLIEALRGDNGPPIRATPVALDALSRNGWTYGGLRRSELREDPLWAEWFDEPGPASSTGRSLTETDRLRIIAICQSAGVDPEGLGTFDHWPAWAASNGASSSSRHTHRP